jgi:plasmid stabilization system protein ParE
MKVEITIDFRDKLLNQIEFIAKDKPLAARKFKKVILNKIKELPRMPKTSRQSIFFDRKDIRDLIVMGYVIVFKIDEEQNKIIVFGFNKNEKNLF